MLVYNILDPLHILEIALSSYFTVRSVYDLCIKNTCILRENIDGRETAVYLFSKNLY